MAIADNIRVWYALEGLTDSHGAGPAFTNTNAATFVAGKVSNGVDTDTTDQSYLSVANASAGIFQPGTSSFSYSVWAKFNTLPASNNMPVIRFGAINGTSPGINCLVSSSGQILFRFGSGSTLYSFASASSVISVSTWHHIVCTIDRTGNMTGYVDGVQVGTPVNISAASAVDVQATEDFHIGGLFNNYSDAVFDEFMMWDGVMSGWIRSLLYNGGSGIGYDDFILLDEFYATDFSEYSTGSLPSDWTSPWYTSTVPTVEADASLIGGKYLDYASGVGSNSSNLAQSPVQLNSGAQHQMLLRFRSDNISAQNSIAQFWMRTSGSSASTVGVCFYIDTAAMGFFRLNPTYAPLGTTAAVSPADDTWYWLRVQVAGSTSLTLKARLWTGDFEDEPGTWSIEKTGSVAINSGGCGPVKFHTNGTFDIDWFSVGDGEAAPGPPAAGGAVDISPSSITSDEAFGDHTVAVGVSFVAPSSITSGEAFGDHVLTAGLVDIAPSSVTSDEAFGSVVVSIDVELTLTGIASGEEFGDHTVSTGLVDLSPSSISSDEAFGDHTVSVGAVDTSPSSITSAEAFGSATITTGAVEIAPSSISSSEAFGDHVVSVVQDVAPSSITSEEAFGSHTVTIGTSQSITVDSGMITEEAFGTITVSPQAVDITFTGIASDEAFGTAIVNPVLQPTGITSDEAFGSAVIVLYLLPSSIGSDEAFGTPSFVDLIVPSSIASAEAFGTASVSNDITPTGIASAEAFGSPFVGFINPEGIASAEAFGTLAISRYLLPDSIVSSETFGTPTLLPYIVPVGIVSEEAFGSAVLSEAIVVSPSAIDSEEAFGSVIIVPEQILQPTGIASSEAFSGHIVADSNALIAWIDEDLEATVGQTSINIPINVPNTSAKNILGFVVNVGYDENLMTITSSSTAGTLASGWFTSTNAATPGTIRIVGAAASPLVGAGVLLNVVIDSVDAPGYSALTLAISWNEGTPAAVVDDGAIFISTTGITASNIASSEAFGTPVISTSSVPVAPSGIASAGVVSQPTVSTGLLVNVSGISSAETFGTLSIDNVGILPPSISEGGVGTPTVANRATLVGDVFVRNVISNNQFYNVTILPNEI